MSDDPHDPLPGILAAVDQALAMSAEISRVTRGFYDAFKDAGFTDAQALWLANAQFKNELGEPPA